jgi:hypothetical protein
LEAEGDAIIAVIDGAAECSAVKGSGGKTGQKAAMQKTVLLDQGESAFAGRRGQGERLSFTGDFTLFVAAAPE